MTALRRIRIKEYHLFPISGIPDSPSNSNWGNDSENISSDSLAQGHEQKHGPRLKGILMTLFAKLQELEVLKAIAPIN